LLRRAARFLALEGVDDVLRKVQRSKTPVSAVCMCSSMYI
jgi:hypothetical protein